MATSFSPSPKSIPRRGSRRRCCKRLRTQTRTRGFANIAGRVAITFSGWAQDEREIYAIPEIRAYWQALDRQLPELPALLTILPIFRYNGPGQHLLLSGTVDLVLQDPTSERYQAHVVEAPQLVTDALARIRRAGRRYQLPDATVRRLSDDFRRGAGGG